MIIIDCYYFQAQEKYWDLIPLPVNRFVFDVILTYLPRNIALFETVQENSIQSDVCTPWLKHKNKNENWVNIEKSIWPEHLDKIGNVHVAVSDNTSFSNCFFFLFLPVVSPKILAGD